MGLSRIFKIRKPKRLYYVVELETQPGDSYYAELTGDKTISLYRLWRNRPIIIKDFTVDSDMDNTHVIQDYLDSIKDTNEYILIRL